MSTVLREFLLGFADDEHLMGQQHTEWVGVAPFLEEDLAFSSIGQDELGHAVLLYELVLGLDQAEATDAAVDELAYYRPPELYRSCALSEHVTTDWGEALVRHWVYDAAEQLRWANVAGSAHRPLAEVVGRAEREERFHRRHADALVGPLLDDQGSGPRIQGALDRLLPLVPTVTASVEGEDELVGLGIISQRTDALTGPLAEAISQRFARHVALAPAAPGRSGRSGDFAPLMARMREVLDLDPTALW